MRILIAPDKFAGTLTAVEAAEAIASGWRRSAPDAVLDLAPMSDGGPGFVDVMHAGLGLAGLGGELLATTVSGPHGAPTPATILLVQDTAYVESAQACGVHLTERRDPESATTTGVGDLLLQAIAAGATKVVLGLGGSGTTDGGAGMLGRLGATADVDLDRGVAGLAEVSQVNLAAAVAALGDVAVVAATDVSSQLTGLFGAARTFGAQKGITEERLPAVDAILEQWAAACDRRLATAPGAGAAGGLGYGLMLLGARREPGLALVAETVGLAARAAAADLVVTGEGSFDFSSRAGKVPAGVAAIAADAVRPCVALAGSVLIGSREMRTLGIESAYAMTDLAGEAAALARPAEVLADLAANTARTWAW